MSRDIYQEVTDRIIAALEAGVAPWVQPWHTVGFPRNGATGRRYNGINVFLLWLTIQERGYNSEEWFTFQQVQGSGGRVRKGEKATLVTFWRMLKKAGDGADEENERAIPLLRYFYVFNRDQCDGLPEPVRAVPRSAWERNHRIDDFVRATGATIHERGDRAGYCPATDEIVMPPLHRFHSQEAFYATELHELVHWTGRPSRLDRLQKGARFGSEAYAREELVAEMGAAFLCAHLELGGRLQHPEYIADWLEVLRNDKRAVIHAASQARQAAEYLGAASEETDEETAELQRAA